MLKSKSTRCLRHYSTVKIEGILPNTRQLLANINAEVKKRRERKEYGI